MQATEPAVDSTSDLNFDSEATPTSTRGLGADARRLVWSGRLERSRRLVWSRRLEWSRRAGLALSQCVTECQ